MLIPVWMLLCRNAPISLCKYKYNYFHHGFVQRTQRELTEETNKVCTIEKINVPNFSPPKLTLWWVFGWRVVGVGRGHSCSFRLSTSQCKGRALKRRNAAGKILNATSKPFPSAKKTVALVQLHREKLKNSDVVSEPILYRINRAKRSTPASFLSAQS